MIVEAYIATQGVEGLAFFKGGKMVNTEMLNVGDILKIAVFAVVFIAMVKYALSSAGYTNQANTYL